MKNDQDPNQEMPSAQVKAGIYLVATPIGHLGDITLRALETLKACDLIYCEDTRVSGKLLHHYGIKKPLRSLHDHNEEDRAQEVIDAVTRGQVVGVISDAGMPLISDPGYKLVQAAVQADIPVTSLPGANSVLTALQLSGLPSDRFLFLGFLPSKSKARRESLSPFVQTGVTVIYFESAQRLADSLEDVANVFGECSIAVCRELTKFYEEILRGSVMEVMDRVRAHPVKGEVVVVVSPPTQNEKTYDVDALLRAALATHSLRDAVDQVMAQTGLSRKEIYPRALELKNDTQE